MAFALEDEILPILVKAFPKAFFPRDRSCLPLRIGVFEALDSALPTEIDRLRLRLYLGIYTKQSRYLRELTLGAIRIGLDGRPAGRVSAKEATSAAARLQKSEGSKFGAPVAKPSVPFQAFALELARRAEPQRVVVVLKKRKVFYEERTKHVRDI